MIKAVFFDIDGTLLSHKLGKIPEDTREALVRLREKGIKIFFSSGRHILELKQMHLDTLPVDGYVLLNGQLCLDKEQRLISHNVIQNEDLKKIQYHFEERKLPIALVEAERMYINFYDERIRITQDEVSSPVPPVEEYFGDDVYLVMLFAEEKECEEVICELRHCKVTRSGLYCADIVNDNGGKAAGIRTMLELYKLSREEIMAFGDGQNDMEMLKFAAIGVAMGNAGAEVKACADYITADVDHGGIRKALHHFGIL